ncbi:class I SAM-dependent methyltransferase [Microlunatus speluncae]|uniref:class I SAM-dependent methyltransferase n=1 Tax=Microlunatus speluncae TaxID=2594267 RepID=UPI0012663A11|nr:class I SAM-dependent methyltransferase [Microlunatus speluncae]
MRPSRSTPFPAEAPAWMVGDRPALVLDVGTGRGGLAGMLHEAGHRVCCLDRSEAAVRRLALRNAGPVVVGQVESLPFLACHFDVVTAAQTLHQFAPGLALSEIARVLRPGGHLSALYVTRDDTVPWVQRLAALLQKYDPEAMAGDYGADSIDWIADSPYFAEVTRRNFRNWVPADRDDLREMVQRRPATAQLPAAERDQLLAQVDELYASVARPPEPLMLPYQISCWRAVVDHSQLNPAAAEDGVQIRL